MSERPILFKGRLVRRILPDEKTQTRRIVKYIPELGEPDDWCGRDIASIAGDYRQFCPYGVAGDRLWVKETWRAPLSLDRYSPSAIAQAALDAGYSKAWAPVQYVADGAHNGNIHAFASGSKAWGKTRVSIHMPRWASRITLEVVSVRVERLHEITADDARAEGVERYDDDGVTYYGPLNRGHACAKVAFERLWDEINGKPRPVLDDDGEPVLDDNERPIMLASRSWASNPWVWRVEFKRVATEARAA